MIINMVTKCHAINIQFLCCINNCYINNHKFSQFDLLNPFVGFEYGLMRLLFFYCLIFCLALEISVSGVFGAFVGKHKMKNGELTTLKELCSTIQTAIAEIQNIDNVTASSLAILEEMLR